MGICKIDEIFYDFFFLRKSGLEKRRTSNIWQTVSISMTICRINENYSLTSLRPPRDGWSSRLTRRMFLCASATFPTHRVTRSETQQHQAFLHER